MSDERRHFIRHPVDMPIQLVQQSDALLKHISMSDVGEGGVAFVSNVVFEYGVVLNISMPHVQPPFEASCVVCWWRLLGEKFEIGVRFLDADSRFRARMVEQVCHIEDYRQQAKKAGRNLTPEQSAVEWISQYAADFGGRG